MTATEDARPAPAPPTRGGAVTAAAALACLQAGVTAVTTVLVLLGAKGDGAIAEIGLGLVQVVGVALLLVGAVQLLRDARRSTLLAGCGLELVLCVYYLVRYASAESAADGLTSSAVVVIPVLLAAMPATSLLLAMSRPATGVPAAGGGRAVAAVLALAHAGVALVVTGVLVLGLALIDVDGDHPGSPDNTSTPLVSTAAGDVVTDAGPGELWAVSLVQLAAVALLIVAGVRLAAGRTGALFPIAIGAHAVLCGYWLVRGTDPMPPVTLLVLPVVSLVLARRQAETPVSTGI